MAINADEVRFSERDTASALGVAASLGAILGGTAGWLSATWSGMLVGAIVGAFVALFAGGGAAIVYAILRGRGSRRVCSFVIGVSLGASVPPLLLAGLLEARSLSGGDPVAVRQALIALLAVFVASALPTGVFLSFWRRSRWPPLAP
jgi:hypothetical protein